MRVLLLKVGWRRVLGVCVLGWFFILAFKPVASQGLKRYKKIGKDTRRNPKKPLMAH